MNRSIVGLVGDLGTVERVNAWIVKCAENLVLTGAESSYTQELAAWYSRFRVETELRRFREPKVFLIANRTRCIEAPRFNAG